MTAAYRVAVRHAGNLGVGMRPQCGHPPFVGCRVPSEPTTVAGTKTKIRSEPIYRGVEVGCAKQLARTDLSSGSKLAT